MAEYILQILRTQLMVVFSWGFNSPRKLPDDKGLSFIVNGFKYQVNECPKYPLPVTNSVTKNKIIFISG